MATVCASARRAGVGLRATTRTATRTAVSTVCAGVRPHPPTAIEKLRIVILAKVWHFVIENSY